MDYKAYWDINKKLKIVNFKDGQGFDEMCEDITVSNGEENIPSHLMFVLDLDNGKIIKPDYAYQYFRWKR